MLSVDPQNFAGASSSYQPLPPVTPGIPPDYLSPGVERESQRLLAPTPEFLATVKVFPLIPSLKADVIKTIDSALSWELAADRS